MLALIPALMLAVEPCGSTLVATPFSHYQESRHQPVLDENNNVHYTALSSNNGADLMLGYGSGDAGAINDHLLFKASETVFNDSSANRDFRVESGTQTHALYVQGSTGNVSIGATSPAV